MWIRRNEIFSRSVNVSEIAAASARNDYLSPDVRVVFDHERSASALSSLDRAKQASRTAADDDRVEIHLSEVPFPQSIFVVPNVAGHNIGQCPG